MSAADGFQAMRRYSNSSTIFVHGEQSTHVEREPSRIGDQEMLPISSRLQQCVNFIREPIADIQAKRGISRVERFTFVDLMTALFHNSYNCFIGIFTMLIGLLPLLEGLLNLLRFILDKILEIDECQSVSDRLMKLGIFLAELSIIFAIVSLIVTIILLPIANLLMYTLWKVWRLAN